MRKLKFTVKETVMISGSLFVLHVLFSVASWIVKFRLWDLFYKTHADLYDCLAAGFSLLIFISSLAIWGFADTRTSKRIVFAGISFSIYLAVIFVILLFMAVGFAASF